MIIPSIDIQNGNAVQLIGGKEMAVDGGNPHRWAADFGIASEIAVIDLDAALSNGSNKQIIMKLLSQYPCRVGGGIRSVSYATELLDAGARRIIIGTSATPEFLMELPRSRTIAALDARNGDIVIEGWTARTGIRVEDRIGELKELVSGFLVTLVETEGSLKGIDVARCIELKKLCGDVSLTVAGGVKSIEEIAVLDAAGIDVQVGMALYTGKISYADAFIAPLAQKIPDALWPTVVCDERGVALGLAWSNRESIQAAFNEKRGIYYSRSRKEIWRKGETSGATQKLLRVDLDCDRDCLRFTVEQNGDGFCHNNTYSCWGGSTGITKLTKTLDERLSSSVPGSYTARLFDDEDLLKSKVVEEAKEFIRACSESEIVAEASDLIYFVMALLAKNNVPLSLLERELDMRSLKISRRGGDKKPFAI